MHEREERDDPAVHQGEDPWWTPRPEMVRMVHGIPRGVVRSEERAILALGNAVVPQVAEVVGWVVRGIHDRLHGGMA
jgi:hypothetical protein